jgi:transposase InsO family protein
MRRSFPWRHYPSISGPAYRAGDDVICHEPLELFAGILGGFNRSSQHSRYEPLRAIDLFSRRVVGWSMSDSMTAQLVTEAPDQF